MYLLTILLIMLATLVTLGSSGGVIETPPIDPDCKAKAKPCANLYFYDENDVVLLIHQGTNATMGPDFPRGIKGVSKVQTVGEYGCYTIFKQKNHGKRGTFCWEGNDKNTIGPGTDYEWTVVRSVEYDPLCNCPSRAGIPPWAIAVSILIVLIVAVAIFFIYRRKRASSDHEAVSTNDKV